MNFNLFNNKKIEPYIGEIEPYIGEIYCSCFEGMCISGPRKGFYKIRKSDITDKFDEKIKISGKWFNKDQMFLYDDIYNPFRDLIQKKYHFT